MSRPQLAAATGISVPKIARCESRGPSPEEAALLAEALGLDAEAAPAPDDGRAWRGLLPDDRVRLVDGEGKLIARTWYRFVRHVKTEDQEYVEIKRERTGAIRCVDPARLRDSRGRRPK